MKKGKRTRGLSSASPSQQRAAKKARAVVAAAAPATSATSDVEIEFATLPTPLLIAWGSDYVGWTDADGLNRASALQFCSRNSIAAPSRMDAVKCYREFVDDPKAAIPHRRDDPDSDLVASTQPENDEGEEEEEDVDDGDEEEESAAEEGAGAACTHCTSLYFGSPSERFKCPACDFVSGIPADAPVNQQILARTLARAPPTSASGKTTAGQSTHDAADSASAALAALSTPKLSAADREFIRLAEDGDPFPRFASTKQISAKEAILELRTAFKGSMCAHVSPALVQYIQSGKFMAPSLAVPRSALEAAEAKAKEVKSSVLELLASASSTPTLPSRKITNTTELGLAFFSLIGPALFAQPRALLDWFTLMRSVFALSAERGWDAAEEYLTAVLGDHVPQRKGFGAYDRDIGSEILSRACSAPAQQAAPRNGAAAPYGDRPSHADAKDECCRNWNYGRCVEDASACPMRKAHTCMWKACKDNTPHRGMACASKPKDAFTPGGPGKGTPAAARRGPRGGGRA